VLVQPSVYGTDNSAIEEALQSNEFELRAIAVVSESITDKEIERLHALGFRGIRINTASIFANSF
jgi:predicted TIM-barrel fold metal-dependent hydrolase